MGPSPFPLMHPTLVARPFHRAGWIYEEKVDGWRMVAIKSAAKVRLISRQGRDHTSRFPELVATLRALDGPVILDGEVAVYDRQLVSRFEWLRHSSPPALATPPLFMVFDCLYARGKDLRSRPLYVRRNVVEDVLDGEDLLLPVRRLSDDGLKAWQEAVAYGFEGLVAKDPTSPYVGGRTLKWLKVKQPRYRERERGWEPKK
jgi:bifunctional non-homologous end joining protein LigD